MTRTKSPVGRPRFGEDLLDQRYTLVLSKRQLRGLKRISAGRPADWLREVIDREVAKLSPPPEKFTKEMR